MKTPEELAREHWEYIGGLLAFFVHDGLKGENLYDFAEYLYTTAMIHGYKHSQDAKEEQ